MDALIVLLIGVLLAALGIFMAVSGNPSLLHSYHYATTPPEELPALARETGIGLAVSGAGVMLMAPSITSVLPSAVEVSLTVAGIVLLVGGIAGTLAAVIRHNGALVTFGGVRGMPLGRRNEWVVLAVCMVAGVVVALTCIMPGAHMMMTGDVSSLHSYHYVNVAAADMPAFATGEGLSMIGLGVGLGICLVSGGLGMAVDKRCRTVSRVLAAVGGVLAAVSLAAGLLVIVYYNGSLMG